MMDELGNIFPLPDDDNEMRRPRRFRRRINDFEELDDIDFRARYRLIKPAVAMLLRRIQPGLEHLTERNRPITPMMQLLVALRFYATGSFLMTVGDCSGISKWTAWRIVHRISPLIAELLPDVIYFPDTEDDRNQTEAELFARAGFPRVLACVDGRQVRVQSFGGEMAERFRNRHGWFSINVQGMCNARLEFVDFVARWPGATHDATVFRNSRIRRRFEEGEFGESIVLGDSGYPELPYLRTPLRNPRTPSEHLYNEAQIRTRNCIERCFGLWARRFAVVQIGSRFHRVERTLPVIVATAVLHNIALRTDPFLNLGDVDVDAYLNIRNNIRLGAGRTPRDRLINGYFEDLWWEP